MTKCEARQEYLGGVSSELRSAAVKMVFVKEENTSEPETWRIKHGEPKPRIRK